MNHVRLRPTGRLLAVLAAASLVVAACGDDDETAASDDPAPSETTVTDDPTTTSEEEGESPSGEGETIEVTAVDYAFEDLPERIDVGTRLTLVNESSVEVHELVAIRIPDDEERPVEELVGLPDEELDAIFGGGPPALVVLSPPGASAEEAIPALGDGTFTEPGRYALVCFIPLGADPDAYLAAAQEATDGPPQVEGGPPHVTEGMYAELIVE